MIKKVCSNTDCDYVIPNKTNYNYCPHCGTKLIKMDVEVEIPGLNPSNQEQYNKLLIVMDEIETDLTKKEEELQLGKIVLETVKKKLDEFTKKRINNGM